MLIWVYYIKYTYVNLNKKKTKNVLDKNNQFNALKFLIKMY